MSMSLSSNTQAILLLTAPLIVGRNEPSADLLTPAEYKRLARFLREKQQQPADLLAPNALALLGECQQLIDSDRLKRLLGRGFLLSQALERWQTKSNRRPISPACLWTKASRVGKAAIIRMRSNGWSKA